MVGAEGEYFAFRAARFAFPSGEDAPAGTWTYEVHDEYFAFRARAL